MFFQEKVPNIDGFSKEEGKVTMCAGILLASQLHEGELVLTGTAHRAQPVIRQAEKCHAWRDSASRISCFRIVDITAHETLEAVEFQFHHEILHNVFE